jgi:hypothetical protein
MAMNYSLSGMTDAELREYIALQERYRDQGEPDTRACAETKLHHLYAEIEARTKRGRLRVVE